MLTPEPIIYVPGSLADGMGAIHLDELAQRAASLSRQSVTVLTYGPSKHHSFRRFRSDHLPLMITDNKVEEAIRRLQLIRAETNKTRRENTIDALIALLRQPEAEPQVDIGEVTKDEEWA
jgi:hypothetical protein